ncbi:MAG: SDR family NAD(P)-dependent oxidoreductase [Candidatus Margulisbacteria bacterium]|jgi:NAD(P)-dependent dehydrogenase (short-subunit alcohol dehydrogenase family)|nr:SDR family NAD(P)-dependent oxidoreductase [Candidatus Margulisiibacteriota bacterium]
MTERSLQTPLKSGFNAKSTARQIVGQRDLRGKNIIVTGGYSGIGREITRALAGAGASVLVPARDLAKARKNLRGIPGVAIDALDLLEPASIDLFADRFLAGQKPLHILINCAGIMAPPLTRDRRGYESQFAINHLGHFQLTARLWPALRQADGARVVAVSSRAQRMGGVNFADINYEQTAYQPMQAYAQSKTANVLFAVRLDALARKYGVRAFAAHPGLVPGTDLGRQAANPLVRFLYLLMLWKKDLFLRRRPHHSGDELKNIRQGAATPVWCALSEELNGKGGVYCEDCNIASAVTDRASPYGVLPWAIDAELAAKLWTISEKMTGVKFLTN